MSAAEIKNIMGEEFLKAKCLMNCEVSFILEHKYKQQHQQQQMADDQDPTMNQMSQVFEKSLEYVNKRFNRYKNPESARQVRKILSRCQQLGEVEICILGNLCLETVDEAIAMAPSISALDDDAIQKMLNDLYLLKKFDCLE